LERPTILVMVDSTSMLASADESESKHDDRLSSGRLSELGGNTSLSRDESGFSELGCDVRVSRVNFVVIASVYACNWIHVAEQKLISP